MYCQDPTVSGWILKQLNKSWKVCLRRLLFMDNGVNISDAFGYGACAGGHAIQVFGKSSLTFSQIPLVSSPRLFLDFSACLT